jgi:hypothetical protein
VEVSLITLHVANYLVSNIYMTKCPRNLRIFGTVCGTENGRNTVYGNREGRKKGRQITEGEKVKKGRKTVRKKRLKKLRN